ncbi:hypothetical protein [Serratia phage vB_SmaM_Yaphecito]|uniref:Uncharacterized protein n=1 Tax=Serratia phage vB_SmaM_Yaphecito TaxID=2777368 RepID=A0A7T3TLX8_9CAUD|nr:hypothetical protein [Serratia phage vB_SmaM_Yaphecito]
MDEGFEINVSPYDLLLAESESERIGLESEAIDDEIQEIGRRTDLYDEVEEGVDHEGDVTQHELALISQATAALFGDINNGGMPSMESADGTISMEAFADLARNMKVSARDLLVRLWRLITDFWENMGTRVSGVSAGANATRERAKDIIGTQPKVSKFDSGITAARYLNFRGKKTDKFSSIYESLKELEHTVESLLSTWAIDVVKSGDEVLRILNKTLSSTNPENAQEIETSLLSANDITSQLMASVHPNLRKEVQLPANGTLVFNLIDSKDVRSQVNKARALQRSGFTFNSGVVETEGATEVDVFTVDQIRELMDVSLRITEIIRRYRERNKLNKLAEDTLTLVRSAKVMSGNLENDISDNRQGAAKNALYNYGNAYASWSRQPTLPIISLTITYLRIVQSMCNRSINAYL